MEIYLSLSLLGWVLCSLIVLALLALLIHFAVKTAVSRALAEWSGSRHILAMRNEIAGVEPCWRLEPESGRYKWWTGSEFTDGPPPRAPRHRRGR